jgi:excinuclease UvrABC helicase subunit UvrB
LEIEELKRQRDEQCEINAFQDIKWKEVVQKVTNEKQVALQQLETMELQHAETLEEHISTITKLNKKLEFSSWCDSQL